MANIHYQRLTVLLFLLCGGYAMMYFVEASTYSMNHAYDVLFVSNNVFSSCFILDHASLSFSAVVMYISGCVFFFSRYYMSGDTFYYRFTWILTFFVASMNILILSSSLLSMLVGWDGLGVSSFALIMYYQSKESLVASFLTLLINRLGDIMLMSSMVLFVMMGSSLLINYSLAAGYGLMFLMALAALTKSAQYPFCAWLPAAMAAPTPVSALVHSSTLVTAGVYILIRACSSNSIPGDVCSLLLFVGSVTSLIGGLCAAYENDLKKLIALSTLSQLGVMMFSLGLGMHNLALLHLFTHAMFKALLFLVAGCILLLSYGVQDIRLLGAVTRNSPLLLTFMNISSFCLMGMPFLSAFYSKHLILSTMWCQEVNSLSIVLMLIGTFMSSVYMLRMLKSLNWGCTHTVCVSMPPDNVGYYVPMVMLFMGSCYAGWGFSMLDTSYTMGLLIKSSYDVLVYLVMFCGSVIGVLLYKSCGNKTLSTMFFMVPTWYNINFFSYYIVRSLKDLESGWLEPHSYSGSFMSFVGSVNILSKWPTSSMDFSSFFILGGGVFMGVWFFLS